MNIEHSFTVEQSRSLVHSRASVYDCLQAILRIKDSFASSVFNGVSEMAIRELSWLDIENIKRKLRNKARLRIKNQRDWLDGRGAVTVKTDEGSITKERLVEQQSRQEKDLRPEPLITTHNKYAGKKKCNQCLDYLFLCHFSADPRNVDGKQGICKQCRNENKRETNTQKRWKRGG